MYAIRSYYAVTGIIAAGGQFHPFLFDKGGQKMIKRLHDLSVAAEFENAVFFYGANASVSYNFV